MAAAATFSFPGTTAMLVDARSSTQMRSVGSIAARVQVKLQCLQYSTIRQRRLQIFSVAAPERVDHLVSTPEEVLEEPSPLVPTPLEIQSLLTEVCDETKIAELELKVGDFKLHMKRNVDKPSALAPVPVAAPAPAPAPAAPALAAAATSTPAPSGPKVSPLMAKAAVFEELQRAGEESGLVFVSSPKVGLFRQSRLVKGKVSPPLCREGQSVKEGQVVCYLEQLGTSVPVEAEIAGDVIKILWEDGAPVGYGDPLIAINPKKS